MSDCEQIALVALYKRVTVSKSLSKWVICFVLCSIAPFKRATGAICSHCSLQKSDCERIALSLPKNERFPHKTEERIPNPDTNRPTKHSLPLSKLANLSSEWKVGGFCRLNQICTVLVFKKSFNLSLFMKFVLFLLKPTYIWARAMPRAQKGQQKVPILKKTT